MNAEYVIKQQTGEKVSFKRTLFACEEKSDGSIRPSDISSLSMKTAQEYPGVLSQVIEKIKSGIKNVRDFFDKEK